MKTKIQEAKIEVRFVRLPKEREAGFYEALRWLVRLMRKEIKHDEELPICFECGNYLHITTEGKQVCRNEICPNYS